MYTSFNLEYTLCIRPTQYTSAEIKNAVPSNAVEIQWGQAYDICQRIQTVK